MAEEKSMERSEPAANAGQYDESMIQVLEGLEAVRKRPGMYIGDTTPRGLHHLVYEIVDNSIDEASAGFCRSILVKINADGSCSVVDDGRGIPVGIHPKMGIPTVEVVFGVLHAGGKFEHNANSAYKVSGGLHGVGASVVNALSEWLEVEVSRDGKVHHMEFERGHKSGDMKVIGKRDKTGTKVTFKPDKEIFPDTEFRYEVLASRLRELAYLNEGLQIILEDERTGKREEFKYEKGLLAFVQHLNDGKNVLHPNIIHFKKDDPATGLTVEVAMQYNDGYNESILSFANNINTHEGGTHLSGFKTALTGTVNRYAENQKLLKDVRPTGDDLREGLYRLVSSMVTRHVTTVFTTEVPDLIGDLKISRDGISFLADNIILLRYVEIESALQKALMVVKMRTSDHAKEMRRYQITDQGIKVEQPFTQYNGILSGIPTLRAVVEPRPYTTGLSERDESLMQVLLALREATPGELAGGLGDDPDAVQQRLERLCDTGYVIKASRGDQLIYRVALVSTGTKRRSRPHTPNVPY
jgi:DNA gyrase subunit B